MCHLENEPEEAHAMNQSILYNHGTPFLLSYLKKKTPKSLLKKLHNYHLLFLGWKLIVFFAKNVIFFI